MKNRNLAHICAYISLAISSTLLVLWCCNVGGFTVVSLDSFVGVIVALLAIVVTMAVGWQIYNSVEIKSQIKELSSLKEKLNIQEQTTNQLTGKAQHLISYILGNEAYKEERYIDAFRCLMSSLKYSLQLENPLNIESLLIALKQTNSIIKNGDDFDPAIVEDIIMYNNEIKSSSGYSLIKYKYETIYESFSSKVKDNRNE